MDGLLRRVVIGTAIGLAAFVVSQQVIAIQGVAQAQDQVQTPATNTARGELVKVDPSERTFIVKTAVSELEFHYNDQTRVIGAQHGTAGLATLTGAQVIVEYKTEGQVDLALSIEIRSPQPPPAVSAP